MASLPPPVDPLLEDPALAELLLPPVELELELPPQAAATSVSDARAVARSGLTARRLRCLDWYSMVMSSGSDGCRRGAGARRTG